MVRLCEWVTLSQVSSEENNRKDKTRKKYKEKKNKCKNKRKGKEMRKVKKGEKAIFERGIDKE